MFVFVYLQILRVKFNVLLIRSGIDYLWQSRPVLHHNAFIYARPREVREDLLTGVYTLQAREDKHLC